MSDPVIYEELTLDAALGLAESRGIETHYAPNEVPGVDVRECPEQPRYAVAY